MSLSSVRRLVLPLVAAACVLTSALMVQAKDKLPDLRRNLMNAHEREQYEQALFDLTEKIGEDGFYADHGAFADWLKKLPDGKPEVPIVQQRIGWALVRASRGDEAIPFLEVAMKDEPSNGLTRSYLGEALRQAKRYMDAAEMLTTAVRCGERGKSVHESLVSTLIRLQREKLSGHADDLPEYVVAAEKYLEVNPDPRIHQMVADMLLTDFKTFEKPDRERGQHWAEVAAKHVLAAVNKSTEKLANGAQMAYDSAVALAYRNEVTDGRSLRFDMLCMAYRLGIDPADGSHKKPQVLTLLAEDAAAEGRFELAYRIAQERLEISNSPRARRLLLTLPPDLGIEEED